MLQQQGGLANASGPFDANHSGVPVDFCVQIALEVQTDFGYLAMIIIIKLLNLNIFHNNPPDDASRREGHFYRFNYNLFQIFIVSTVKISKNL
jgi:hypothetical protein